MFSLAMPYLRGSPLRSTEPEDTLAWVDILGGTWHAPNIVSSATVSRVERVDGLAGIISSEVRARQLVPANDGPVRCAPGCLEAGESDGKCRADSKQRTGHRRLPHGHIKVYWGMVPVTGSPTCGPAQPSPAAKQAVSAPLEMIIPVVTH
ncbi:hypothetical protein EYF80_003703 [Liparis tanakae]|uniref:Uncharacterized protein n=1 Tax=Liparis tanakae TaxID=230148 RepID=A0A4Z2J6P5_9TELE|nr:hypothetical protein EYF80_003703 [Liparis tanakae]